MSEVPIWQRGLFDRMAADVEAAVHAPRRSGKRQALVNGCALAEFAGVRWDIVAGTPEAAQDIRREARERAAWMAERIGRG